MHSAFWKHARALTDPGQHHGHADLIRMHCACAKAMRGQECRLEVLEPAHLIRRAPVAHVVSAEDLDAHRRAAVPRIRAAIAGLRARGEGLPPEAA